METSITKQLQSGVTGLGRVIQRPICTVGFTCREEDLGKKPQSKENIKDHWDTNKHGATSVGILNFSKKRWELYDLWLVFRDWKGGRSLFCHGEGIDRVTVTEVQPLALCLAGPLQTLNTLPAKNLP